MKDYFVHESSYVDEGAEVGKGTKIWHFCHIMSGAKIGGAGGPFGDGPEGRGLLVPTVDQDDAILHQRGPLRVPGQVGVAELDGEPSGWRDERLVQHHGSVETLRHRSSSSLTGWVAPRR